eukprot:6179294-Pleurochrysis_carterae.AAC.1
MEQVQKRVRESESAPLEHSGSVSSRRSTKRSQNVRAGGGTRHWRSIQSQEHIDWRRVEGDGVVMLGLTKARGEAQLEIALSVLKIAPNAKRVAS